MLKPSGKTGGLKDTKIFLEAMSKDKVHLAKFILDALDDKIVDCKAEGAKTPLISSVCLPDFDTRSKFMSLLLHRGASVNHKDENGRTALTYACERGYLDAVKLLVQHNADPEIGDIWGNTALMYAVAAGHFLIVEFLVKAFKRLGLQIDRKNKVGNSAPKVAKYLGHIDCLYALSSHLRKVNGSCFNTFGSGSREKTTEHTYIHDDAPQAKDPAHVACKQEVGFAGTESASKEAACPSTVSLWQRRSVFSQHHMLSMDSIEEYEKESEDSPRSPQEPFFTGVLTPKIPNRYNWKADKHSEKLAATGDSTQFPRLFPRSPSQPVAQFSPRPHKTAPKCLVFDARCMPTTDNIIHSVLMTPITVEVAPEEEDNEKKTTTKIEFNSRRFDDSYYQKRCSLPSTVISPLPLERAQLQGRKFKTGWRAALPLGYAGPLDLPSPPASTSFSTLGNKLLRRFTFPELRKNCKEQDSENEAQCGASGSPGSRIPRSETFPLCTNHPQVASKPSIDSISAVKCEFDLQHKVLTAKTKP